MLRAVKYSDHFEIDLMDTIGDDVGRASDHKFSGPSDTPGAPHGRLPPKAATRAEICVTIRSAAKGLSCAI
jgi:hypothetical protein